MQEKWETMARLPKYARVANALNAGLGNLRKWYKNLDDTDIYFISLILDPGIKMEYFKVHWDDEYLERGMGILNKVFDRYHSVGVDTTARMEPAAPALDETLGSNMTYSSAWMRHAVQERVLAERATADPRHEMTEYLKAPLDMGCKDILVWWQVSLDAMYFS
jgi:hypothetical protein